jgi:hypothetical protein
MFQFKVQIKYINIFLPTFAYNLERIKYYCALYIYNNKNTLIIYNENLLKFFFSLFYLAFFLTCEKCQKQQLF